MRDLAGKNVLITGGALGMGKSLARLRLAEGARVALVDIRSEDLEKTAGELRAGGEVFYLRARYLQPDEAPDSGRRHP